MGATTRVGASSGQPNGATNAQTSNGATNGQGSGQGSTSGDAATSGSTASGANASQSASASGSSGQGGAGGGGQACANSNDCDDGNFCNGSETCENGMCGTGSPPQCDDGIDCTADSCDPVAGECVAIANAVACDDGVFCNGEESCDPLVGDPQTGCVSNAGSPCDDGVACTSDSCDEMNAQCSHTEVDPSCDNGITCDGAEQCDAILGCVSTGALDCNDGIACTSDFCDQVNDGCVHVPVDQLCDNGSFCDGLERCEAQGCVAGVAPDCDDGVGCTIDGCSNALAACTHVADSGLCDDGVICNGSEVCSVGVGCSAGAPLVCNDFLSCTVDVCVEAQGGCAFSPNHAACDDGLDCNGQETCVVAGFGPTGCATGTPIPCPGDGISCTTDACDEATNSCLHTPSNALCPDGQFCVVAQGGCTLGTPCQNPAQCDDQDACNGVETCSQGICQPGIPVQCEDFISCTVDACNPATGACSHTPIDAFCDDGLACNGSESCAAGQGCVSGVTVVCDDGVACTQDACEEPGNCVAILNHGFCEDGSFCNGSELCTAQGCEAGQAVSCPSDGIGCTNEVCDAVANACVSVPNDAMCACGESCSVNQGCGNFCVPATCQGKTYQCGDCLDNDGDCRIDSDDTQCLGPCDNTENSFFGGIPGQNNSPCKSDCYFDQDTGSGNDDCYWSHKCDPLAVAPLYPPEGSQCAYNPNANIPGYSGSCTDAFASQSATCDSYCGPLTPNGCDCFGCCVIPGAPTPVWLGSEASGSGTCDIASLGNPLLCEPCTQVAACLNPCDVCEICIGKPTLPPECNGNQECDGTPACGLPGQLECVAGYSCISGCCQQNPD